MKTFNHFLGKTTLVLFLVFVISTSIAVAYAMVYPDVLDELAIVNSDGDWNLVVNTNKTSDFDTIEVRNAYEVETPVPNIVIDIDTDQVVFIEEERDTIWIEYVAEQPKSDQYTLETDFYADEETLYIHTSSAKSNLTVDKTYKRQINIHIPKDYLFNSISIKASSDLIDNGFIPTQVKSITIETPIASVDLDINTALERLVIDNDYGKIDLNIYEPINTLSINSSIGDITVLYETRVDTLILESDTSNITFKGPSDTTLFIDHDMDITLFNEGEYGFVEDPDLASVIINTDLSKIHLLDNQ